MVKTSQVTSAETALRTVERLVKSGASVEQLERFIALQERVLAQASKAAADEAFAAMQDKLPTIEKNGEVMNRDGVTLRYRYAKFEDVLEAVRPTMAEFGFAPSFKVVPVEGDASGMDVTCVLAHRQGYERASTFRVYPEFSDYMTPTQSVAAARSFGKRHALMDVLGLAARGEDVERQPGEDGGGRSDRKATRQQGGRSGYSSVGDTRPITEKQLGRLVTIMDKAKRPEAVVKAWVFGRYGVRSRKQLTREMYEDCCAAIESPGELPAGRWQSKAQAESTEREPGEEG